jgi:hypothetical protein
MTEYTTRWLDYALPTGEKFAVAVCSYSGRIRHMTIGHDPIRRALAKMVKVERNSCSTAEHCLDLECPLNRTSRDHIAHMLDMRADEPVDTETAGLWGKESAVDCYLDFVQRMNQQVASDAQSPTENENPSNQDD